LLFDQGRYDEAKAEFEKAVSLNAKDAGSWNGLGRVAYAQQRYEDAEQAFRRATELKSDEAAHHRNLGLALGNLKKIEEAITEYRKATEVNEEYADAFLDWGNGLADLGRYDEAIERYREAADADPSLAYAYHNMAHYLFWQGKYEAGRKEWNRAREVYEQNKKDRKMFVNPEDFQYLGGVLHDVFSELDEAEAIYKEGLQLNPDHLGILSGLVSLYLDKKDQDGDEESGTGGVEGDAKNAAGYWRLREAYKKAVAILKNKLKKAKEETQRRDANNEKRTTGFWRASEAFKKAGGILNEQLKQADEALTYLQLGQLQLKMGECDESEKNLRMALKRDEESKEARLSLGIVYMRKEDFKKAAKQFEAVIRMGPDDLTARSNLAEAYLKAGLVEKAESEYKRILGITPYHVESHIGLGETYTAMGDAGDGDMYDLAIGHFTQGMNIGRSEKGSKRLGKKESAAVLYSRGYARVKLYESQRTRSDESLLRAALEDFKDCCRKYDPDHHKARRASEKIEKRMSRFSSERMAEKVGPLVISVLSFWIFLATQGGFFFVKPRVMEIYQYALLSFGSLIFMVAGLYLPQILKLKVGGIELEKSSVDQISGAGVGVRGDTGTLGIGKQSSI